MRVLLFLALVLSYISMSYACRGNFNPYTTTIGQCSASESADWLPTANAPILTPDDLNTVERKMHEDRMDYILNIGTAAKRKFVASIYHQNGTLMCTGINVGSNAIAHGEIAAINNCTALHGIKYFTNYTLYTTGEPCAMCAGALVWADFKTVVWGTYNADLLCKICMSNIPMDSAHIFGRSYGIRPTSATLIGGVLREKADAFFGSYCSNPNSIYYIQPKCACTA